MYGLLLLTTAWAWGTAMALAECWKTLMCDHEQACGQHPPLSKTEHWVLGDALGSWMGASVGDGKL